MPWVKKWARGTHDQWAVRLYQEHPGTHLSALRFIAEEIGIPLPRVKLHMKRVMQKFEVQIKPSRKIVDSQKVAETNYQLRKAQEQPPAPVREINPFSLSRQSDIHGTMESLLVWADRVLKITGRESVVSLMPSVRIIRANEELVKRGVKKEDLIVPGRR